MKRTIVNTLKQFSAFALLAASLSAQSGSLIAKVPFDFRVKNQQFTAGSYTISANSQGVMLIRGNENHSAMFALTYGSRTIQPESKGRLVFNHYGNQYFLSELWLAQAGCARAVPPSKAEMELARATGKPEIVSLVASGSQPHGAAH
jgi:hypothetical protein